MCAILISKVLTLAHGNEG